MTNARRCLLLLVIVGAACQTPALSVTPSPSAPPAFVATATRASIAPTPVSPTITPTLAPAPRTFREEFDAAAPYWQFMQAAGAPEDAVPQTLTGSLRFSLGAPNQWLIGLYDAKAYAGVRIDAQMELGAGGQGAGGLICRYDPASGWYEFNIYADQTYTLMFGQWLAEGVARYTPLVIAGSEKIRPSVNEIGLSCEGDILTPYINGVQMRKREERLHTLDQGQVGVSAASFEQAPLVISIDWFGVSEP